MSEERKVKASEVEIRRVIINGGDPLKDIIFEGENDFQLLLNILYEFQTKEKSSIYDSNGDVSNPEKTINQDSDQINSQVRDLLELCPNSFDSIDFQKFIKYNVLSTVSDQLSIIYDGLVETEKFKKGFVEDSDFAKIEKAYNLLHTMNMDFASKVLSEFSEPIQYMHNHQ